MNFLLLNCSTFFLLAYTTMTLWPPLHNTSQRDILLKGTCTCGSLTSIRALRHICMFLALAHKHHRCQHPTYQCACPCVGNPRMDTYGHFLVPKTGQIFLAHLRTCQIFKDGRAGKYSKKINISGDRSFIFNNSVLHLILFLSLIYHSNLPPVQQTLKVNFHIWLNIAITYVSPSYFGANSCRYIL